jgi:hypothetical protein
LSSDSSICSTFGACWLSFSRHWVVEGSCSSSELISDLNRILQFQDGVLGSLVVLPLGILVPGICLAQECLIWVPLLKMILLQTLHFPLTALSAQRVV